MDAFLAEQSAIFPTNMPVDRNYGPSPPKDELGLPLLYYDHRSGARL